MTIAFQRYNGSEWVTETESVSGGVTNHASLTNLDWHLAGHTGGASTLAGFDSDGNPTDKSVDPLEIDSLLIKSMKSGATQVVASAVADELWKTASHATLPDNVVMIGV